MELIKKLVGFMKEELDGAETYIKCANKYKTDMPELAKAFYDKSEIEMQHAMNWHDWAIKEIDKEKRELTEKGETIPERMLAYWEIKHEDYVDEMNVIKMLQEVYKKII